MKTERFKKENVLIFLNRVAVIIKCRERIECTRDALRIKECCKKCEEENGKELFVVVAGQISSVFEKSIEKEKKDKKCAHEKVDMYIDPQKREKGKEIEEFCWNCSIFIEKKE